MIFFALAVVLAGISANDPLITACGVFILLAGVGLFVYRQIRHDSESEDSGIKAGIVEFKAPAALVAVVVGALLVLIGRGALTVGQVEADNGEASPPVAAPDDPPVTQTTTTTLPPTTLPPTTVPPSTVPPPTTEPEPPLTELPNTGGGDIFFFGLAILAGGRWVRDSALVG